MDEYTDEKYNIDDDNDDVIYNNTVAVGGGHELGGEAIEGEDNIMGEDKEVEGIVLTYNTFKPIGKSEDGKIPTSIEDQRNDDDHSPTTVNAELRSNESPFTVGGGEGSQTKSNGSCARMLTSLEQQQKEVMSMSDDIKRLRLLEIERKEKENQLLSYGMHQPPPPSGLYAHNMMMQQQQHAAYGMHQPPPQPSGLYAHNMMMQQQQHAAYGMHQPPPPPSGLYAHNMMMQQQQHAAYHMHQPPPQPSGLYAHNMMMQQQQHAAYGMHQPGGAAARSAGELFEQRMDDLKTYKEKHGHVKVKKTDDKSLYVFCRQMRYARSNPEKSNMVLTEGRIASLDALGFDWAVKYQAARKSQPAPKTSLKCIACNETKPSNEFTSKERSKQGGSCCKGCRSKPTIPADLECSVCDETKPSNEFTSKERSKQGGSCCKGCRSKPTMPDDEIELECLEQITKKWNATKGAGQTQQLIDSCNYALSNGIDIRVIVLAIREGCYKNKPIKPPYYSDRIKRNIEAYLKKHLSEVIFSVVPEEERTERESTQEEEDSMIADLNASLNLDPSSGKPINPLPRDYGMPTREHMPIYALADTAIETFQEMNLQANIFRDEENVRKFVAKHQLTVSITRSEHDRIIAEAKSMDSDPDVYLLTVQRKLHDILREQYPGDERTFFFYNSVNYWTQYYFPPTVKRDLLNSNNKELIGIGETADAVKCGHSMLGLMGQADKTNKMAVHRPGKLGAVVVGVPVGSQTSSFANEQAIHLRHTLDHINGEHYDIAGKLNASVEILLGACCQSKVIYVGATGHSAKSYIQPGAIDDKEGYVYEHQRIVDPEVRALMRNIRSNYSTDTPEYKWITLELASKCGSSYKNIEEYLRKTVFWCAPINNLVLVKYKSNNAREDEKDFHEFLLAKAKKEDDPTKHVSGEMF